MDFNLPKPTCSLSRRTRRLHRGRDQAARGQRRQHPLLRPPPRMCAHRLGEWRPAAPRMGGAAARGQAPRRQGGPSALRAPEGLRRQGRHQPRDGGDPRASRGQGPRPPQRSAERALDRRQLPVRHHARPLRHRRAEGEIDGSLTGTYRIRFGLTEPDHGSDATHMETSAVRDARRLMAGSIDGEKMWITGMHVATHCMLFARTTGKDGDARGITCFLVPADTPGREGRGVHVDLQHADRSPAPSASPMSGCRTTRCSARSAAAFRWRSASCTRTASARRHLRWARRSTASTKASNTRASASRSARRWPRTRRSSSRSSSWRRRPKCCGC